MKQIAAVLWFSLTVSATAGEQTFTGVVTDTMCGADHKMMNITPDDKCIRYCVKTNPNVSKYVLIGQGKEYLLSDQETPAQFAAKNVRVTGVFYPKTGVIAVERIESAK